MSLQSVSIARSQGLLDSFCGSSLGWWALLKLLCSQARRKLHEELTQKLSSKPCDQAIDPLCRFYSKSRTILQVKGSLLLNNYDFLSCVQCPLHLLHSRTCELSTLKCKRNWTRNPVIRHTNLRRTVQYMLCMHAALVALRRCRDAAPLGAGGQRPDWLNDWVLLE